MRPQETVPADLAVGPRVAQFVAGDSPAHLEKTLDPAAPCDLWLINWEAAIVDKEAARSTTRRFLESPTRRPRAPRALRVNPMGTAEGRRDLDELAAWPPGLLDGVLLPLVESPAQVSDVAAQVPESIAPRLHLLVETPRAVLRALELATALAATGRAGGLFAGLADFTAAMGVWETGDDPQRNFGFFLGQLVTAARASDLWAVGPVPPSLDMDVMAWARTWRGMGYCGVMTVHPAQSARAIAAFVPDPDRLAAALDRLRALEASGGAATRVGGRVVEVPMCAPDLVVVRYAVLAGMLDPAEHRRFSALFH